jgi:hypothetical protein
MRRIDTVEELVVQIVISFKSLEGISSISFVWVQLAGLLKNLVKANAPTVRSADDGSSSPSSVVEGSFVNERFRSTLGGRLLLTTV